MQPLKRVASCACALAWAAQQSGLLCIPCGGCHPCLQTKPIGAAYYQTVCVAVALAAAVGGAAAPPCTIRGHGRTQAAHHLQSG